MLLRRLGFLWAAALLAASASAAAQSAWAVEGTVAYEARDALASWRGEAPLASIALRFDPQRPGELALEATVRPADFRTGVVPRDAVARRTVFEVARFPEATARVTADPDHPPRRLADGALELPLLVDLDLHGVTLRYAASASVTRDGDGWRGEAELSVSLTAHGMVRPRVLGLVTEDEVTVVVRLVARPAPTPTPPTR